MAPVAPPDIFREEHFGSAEDFLKRLSPFDDGWGKTGGIGQWLFRGQRDAAWQLTPTAMRPKAFTHYGIGQSGPFTPRSLDDQLTAEHAAMMDFANNSVTAGLSVPEDSQWLRSAYLQECAFGSKQEGDTKAGVRFPFPLHRSLYALAQHHGVPTRLLDWTASSFFGAYFASHKLAENLATKKNKPPVGQQSDNMAVWALRSKIAPNFIAMRGIEPLLKMISAPYESNPYLRAQRGSFSLLYYDTPRASNDHRLPALDDIVRKIGTGHPSAPFLIKFTTPISEAPRCLRLLAEININAATVFPSYDGVVQAQREIAFHK